jgi:putative hemolysin
MIAAGVIAGVALVLAAVLRAGGASLLRTTRTDAMRDVAEGVPGADAISRLLEDREVLQPAVTAVHAGLLVSAAFPIAWMIARSIQGTPLIVAMVLLAFGLVLVADLGPRAVGRSRPQRLAYRLAWLLKIATRIGRWANDLLPDAETEEEEPTVAAEEEEERKLISSVIEFSETIVREVMVPRTDMVTIATDGSVDQLLALVKEHGFSRFPVTESNGDEVVGLVIAKDLLPLVNGGVRPAKIGEMMRPIDFVPETKRVSDLLHEMQASKAHLMMAVDEFGDLAGLVTIEDLLEELVGEIVDEYDEDEALVQSIAQGAWRVDGRASVDELSEQVAMSLPDEEWDTVGGLVLALAGRVPEEGEELSLGDLRFIVRRVQGRRVAEVEVRRVHAIEAGGEAREELRR